MSHLGIVQHRFPSGRSKETESFAVLQLVGLAVLDDKRTR